MFFFIIFLIILDPEGGICVIECDEDADCPRGRLCIPTGCDGGRCSSSEDTDSSES